jgi:hypothetical protein
MTGAQRRAPTQPRRIPRARLLMASLPALLVVVVVPAGRVEASPQPNASAQKYLGTWSYDQPDEATMRNIAVISCPPTGNGCPAANFPCR